jgi:hypothetical protein
MVQDRLFVSLAKISLTHLRLCFFLIPSNYAYLAPMDGVVALFTTHSSLLLPRRHFNKHGGNNHLHRGHGRHQGPRPWPRSSSCSHDQSYMAAANTASYTPHADGSTPQWRSRPPAPHTSTRQQRSAPRAPVWTPMRQTWPLAVCVLLLTVGGRGARQRRGRLLWRTQCGRSRRSSSSATAAALASSWWERLRSSSIRARQESRRSLRFGEREMKCVLQWVAAHYEEDIQVKPR